VIRELTAEDAEDRAADHHLERADPERQRGGDGPDQDQQRERIRNGR